MNLGFSFRSFYGAVGFEYRSSRLKKERKKVASTEQALVSKQPGAARLARLAIMIASSTARLSSAAFAQLPTASISGTVHDRSDAAIPGATVTATNEKTGLTHTIQTGPDGHYVLLALPIGVYDVKAEAASFSTQVQQKLTLTVSQEAIINFVMTVRLVSQQVSVTATPPLNFSLDRSPLRNEFGHGGDNSQLARAEIGELLAIGIILWHPAKFVGGQGRHESRNSDDFSQGC
jgi:hypothetical protein